MMFGFKSKIAIYTSIALMVFLFASYKYYDSRNQKPHAKEEVLLQVVVQGLNSAHYSPVPINDAFSQKAYDLYLKRLDFNKKFLLQTDVDKFSKYRTQIDDEIQRSSYTFFDMSTDILNTRIKETEVYVKEILAQPFDYEKEEFIELDPEKLSFPGDKAAQKEEWRKYLKYQAMVRLAEAMDTQEKSKDKDPKAVKTFKELEEDSRKKLGETYNDMFKRLSQLDRNDRLTQYINSIANTYDPHTEYFAPKDKETFDIQFTGQLEGIGATLQEKDGFIRVQEIVVGGPAYKQGELKAGDLILKVGQGDQEPVDIEGMRVDKAVSLIRGKKGTVVKLTVKKKDGSITIIPITRDLVRLEETFAQSALLKGPQNVGYIKLPGFYADFEQKGARSSFTDVKREIEKLKKENIQGLILDLRNNGGGSLQEVVNIVGLFIEQGPVVQVKATSSAPMILSDRDPAIQYDGPLVVLVNETSASASEILAAAIQDYKRGVVMGSNTFGKGTVQQFFNLDRALPAEFASLKPLGELKLTTQKYYRVNGGATQLRGVKPDIILPDTYTYLEFGEKEQDYAMPWDEIKPASFTPWKKASLPLAKLQANSKARTSANPDFTTINDAAKRLKARSDKTKHSLVLKTYIAEQKKAKEEAKKLDGLEKGKIPAEVITLKTDLDAVGSDTVKINRIKVFNKNLQKDIYVYEAMSVIQDIQK